MLGWRLTRVGQLQHSLHFTNVRSSSLLAPNTLDNQTVDRIHVLTALLVREKLKQR